MFHLLINNLGIVFNAMFINFSLTSVTVHPTYVVVLNVYLNTIVSP